MPINIQSALVSTAYATAIGFVATESGMAVSNALENTDELAPIARAIDKISEITVWATGIITGAVLAQAYGVVDCLGGNLPTKEVVRLVVSDMRSSPLFLTPIVGGLMGAALVWGAGEAVRSWVPAKEVALKVATAITIGSSLVLPFSKPKDVALQHVVFGSIAGELTGILLTNALSSLMQKATTAAVVGGATAGILSLARG